MGIFDSFWPSPDEYMAQREPQAPPWSNDGYLGGRWSTELDGGQPFNQLDISRRYNGMQGIDPRAMGESVLIAHDPNMAPPPQFAPQQPMGPLPPQQPAPGWPNGSPTRFAGGQAMGYASEEPRPQQPLAGGPPGPQYAQAGQPPGGPGFGDRLNAGAMGFFNANSPMGALGALLGGITTGQRTDPQYVGQQQRAQEIDIAQQRTNQGLLTEDTKEYEYYLKGLRPGEPRMPFEKWMEAKRRRQEKFGLTPQYTMGKDEKGNEVVTMHQLSDMGGIHTPTLPGGQKVTKPLVKEDTGLAINWRNPFDGTLVKSQPKDPQEVARQGKVGEGIGAAQLKLPEVESVYDSMTAQINELMSHPRLPLATGDILGKLPDNTPGIVDVRERIKQIASQSWTQGIQKLSGLGALSNAEGSRIEAAQARLNTAKGTDEFKAALNELLRAVQVSRQNARLIASGQMMPYDEKDRWKPGGAKDEEKQPAAATGAPKPTSAGVATEGATATNPQTGEKLIFRNGKWVKQ